MALGATTCRACSRGSFALTTPQRAKPAGRVSAQGALDIATLAINGEWRVETRLPPPVTDPTAGAAPTAGSSVALPAITRRFDLLPIAPEAPSVSRRTPFELDALERELTVRKVERDLLELERLRRLDEERAALREKEAQAIPAPPRPAPATPALVPQ